MSKVGFVGLGIMGTPMAGHLITGGHTLYAYDLRPRLRGVAAQCRDCAGTVQRLRRARRQGLGSLGDGAGAGEARELRSRRHGALRFPVASGATGFAVARGGARYTLMPSLRSGNSRMGLPVAAKIAFITAGATTEIGGSPTPPQKSKLGTITVSTFGMSVSSITG